MYMSLCLFRETFLCFVYYVQDEISQSWLNTCYIAYNRTQYMYEKYNAYEVGVGGGGGEYKPQVGFGWSNAVALLLLQETYQPSPDNDDSSSGLSDAGVLAIIFAGAFVAIAVVILVYFHVYYPVEQSIVAAHAEDAPRSSAGVNMSPIAPTTTFGSTQSKSMLDV
jgi:hypothetical protein